MRGRRFEAVRPPFEGCGLRGQDFNERLNRDSEHIFAAKAEPYLAEVPEGSDFQLLRVGYYKTCREGEKLCLSEIVSLKDNFNK